MLRTINFMGVRNVAFGVTLLLTLLAMWAVIGAALTVLVDRTWRRQEAVATRRAFAAAL